MFIVPITKMQPMGSMEEMGLAAEGLGSSPSIPFADILKDAVDTAQDFQQVSKQDAYDLATGNMDNMSNMMINSAKASTAMEVAVQVTSRAVSAYKEIMQMQV